MLNKKRNGGVFYEVWSKNKIAATVKSVKKGDVMSIVKFNVKDPIEVTSVLTTESLDELNLKEGENNGY